MYTNIKIKKNVRKLRIDDPPAKITEKNSSVSTTTNQATNSMLPPQQTSQSQLQQTQAK